MATNNTGEIQYVTANGIKLAYRRLGPSNGIPLLMINHFRSNSTFWDPLLLSFLSQHRPLILIDIAGTGRSSGSVPVTMQEWASHPIALAQALGLTQIDVLGFSMGGLAAQYVALDAPKGLVRKLILCGTRTSRRPDTVMGDRKWFIPLATSESEEEFRQSWIDSFFPPTEIGRAAGAESWKRIANQPIRSPHLSAELAKKQIQAFSSADFNAEKPNEQHAFDRLAELKMPVLVTNGNEDLLIPTVNSWELVGLLPDSQLIIYPNSGHGFLYQYAQLFAEHVKLFLDGPKSRL